MKGLDGIMEEYDADDKYLFLFDDRELDELVDEPLDEVSEEEKQKLKRKMDKLFENWKDRYED